MWKIKSFFLRLISDNRRLESKKKESNVQSGEQPLVFFISSVIDDEMFPARKEAVQVLNGIPGVVPWAFEYTPGSSEDPEEGYLRKVRESDCVIWLVGSTITSPVENELKEAMENDKRLLVFLLPTSQKRNDRVDKMLSKVGKIAKWSKVTNTYPLKSALEETINDEKIRAYRGIDSINRTTRFSEMLNESRARCLARWQAAGLSLTKAQEFYDDISLGETPIKLIELMSTTKLVVVLGDFGSGKSLIGERILQNQIKTCQINSSNAVPILLRAQEINTNVKDKIDESIKGLVNPKNQGVLVIIDGVDEVGQQKATTILEETRALVHLWMSFSAIIISRPLPIFSDSDEKYQVELLDDDEILELISKINGIEIDSRQFLPLPESVKETIRRPFFTILWARYREKTRSGEFSSTGELINYFVEDVITFSNENISKSIPLLETLGYKSIESGGEYVPWREIGGINDVSSLLDTRLIEKKNQNIGFPLPILSQWFAANYLIKNPDLVFGLCENPLNLEKWRYSILIIIGMFPFEDATKILEPVVKTNPGFACELIHEGINRHSQQSGSSLNTARDCGEKIIQIYGVFAEALGDLANHILPIDKNGNLRSLGIALRGDSLLTSWKTGERGPDEIIELPENFPNSKFNLRDWNVIKTRRPGAQSTWPWEWCFAEISENLESLVSQKAFILRDGPMYIERMWEYSLHLMGLGELTFRPLDLNELETKVQKYSGRLRGLREYQIEELKQYIGILRQSGKVYYCLHGQAKILRGQMAVGYGKHIPMKEYLKEQ